MLRSPLPDTQPAAARVELDAALPGRRGLSAPELGGRVVDDCRAFGGDLTEDVALVCVKRTG